MGRNRRNNKGRGKKKASSGKRKRRRRKPEELRQRDAQHGSPSDGEGWVEVGHGEFAAMTIPRDGGPMVVHRFETREEAEAQQARNIAEDQPLVGIDDHKN